MVEVEERMTSVLTCFLLTHQLDSENVASAEGNMDICSL